LPEALSALIMRLLSRSPDARPGSAAEVAAELDGLIATMRERRPASCGRRRWLGVAVGLGGVLLGMGLAALWRWGFRRPTEQQPDQRQEVSADRKADDRNADDKKADDKEAARAQDAAARRAARWALRHGGNVTLVGEVTPVKIAADLPAGPF